VTVRKVRQPEFGSGFFGVNRGTVEKLNHIESTKPEGIEGKTGFRIRCGFGRERWTLSVVTRSRGNAVFEVVDEFDNNALFSVSMRTSLDVGEQAYISGTKGLKISDTANINLSMGETWIKAPEVIDREERLTLAGFVFDNVGGLFEKHLITSYGEESNDPQSSLLKSVGFKEVKRMASPVADENDVIILLRKKRAKR